jgi:hypothetical protein
MRISLRALLLAPVFRALGASTTLSAVYLVAPDGTGDYTTIQQAIDAATHGDSILLAAGTFTGVGNTNLDTGGREIVIASVSGAGSTFIDCEGGTRAFYLHSGEGNGAIITGITVVNGNAHTLDEYGGAVYCSDASPSILECVFQDCYADSGAALYLFHSNARIVRNRFIENNCHTICDGPPRPTVVDALGAIYCIGSDVTIVDNYFYKNTTGIYTTQGAVLRASHSVLSIVGNEFDTNGQAQGGGPVFADSCEVEILGNYFHGNTGEDSGGIVLDHSTGLIRANRFDGNEPHCISGAVRFDDSDVGVDFNLIKDNGGIGITAFDATGVVHRNIVSRGHFICMEDGRGIVVTDCPGLVITNNVLYENCADGSYDHGTELRYSGSAPTIESNVLVNFIEHAMVACDATPSPISFAPADVESLMITDNRFDGDIYAWMYSYQYGCVDQGQFVPCGFCDPDGDNWFLQPGSPCVVDTLFPGGGMGGNDLYVYGFAGALPVGCATSDVLSTTIPPDDIVTSPVVGDVYVLSGFEVTNTSDKEAPVYYRLLFDGDAMPDDQNDPLAFVGVTPVLQPLESYTPPEAALIVPDVWGPSVSTVTYLVAYAPALNMPDTLMTTITFDLPVTAGESPSYRLVLGQNVPNPFNPVTSISYVLPVRTGVTLSIYDVRGRRVATLVDKTEGAGPHSVEWDGRSDAGSLQPTGVYFYRLQAAGRTLTRKMLLIK